MIAQETSQNWCYVHNPSKLNWAMSISFIGEISISEFGETKPVDPVPGHGFFFF